MKVPKAPAKFKAHQVNYFASIRSHLVKMDYKYKRLKGVRIFFWHSVPENIKEQFKNKILWISGYNEVMTIKIIK